jgi:colicin import membrane protein
VFIFQKKYSLSFLSSLIGHFLLFLLLFSTVLFNSDQPYVVKKGLDNEIAKKKVITAVTVNQAQVQQEVQRLKDQQAAKRLAENERVERLQRLANKAKSERQTELNHLNRLKQNQQQLQKQQAAEQKIAENRLAAIKRQQAIQQQRLTGLEQKQTQAANNYKQQQQKLMALQQKQLAMIKEKQQTQAAKALLAKQLQQEQDQLARAKQQYIDGIINKYIALVRQAIQSNWNQPPSANPGMAVTLQIDVTKTGAVSNVTIAKSSGDKALDQSARLAVYKASPLPIPVNNPLVAKQFQEFALTMHPSI